MKKINFWLGILISLVFVYFAFDDVNLNQLVANILKIKWLPLVLAIFLSIFSFWVRSLRWKFFLSDVKEISIKNLFSATMIGYMALNIFPLRLGDFYRAYAIGKMESISKTTSFATIIVERIVDTLTLLFILFLAIFLNPQLQEREFFGRTLKNSAILLSIFTAIALLVLLFPLFAPKLSKKTALFFLDFLPEKLSFKLKKILNSFWVGIAVLTKKEFFFKIIFVSFLMWFCFVGNLSLTLYAFGLEKLVESTFSSSLVVLIVSAFAVMIPAGPGSVGTLDAACKESLIFIGNGLISNDLALGFALINHYVTSFIPVTLVGLYFFWKEKLSFEKMQNESEII